MGGDRILALDAGTQNVMALVCDPRARSSRGSASRAIRPLHEEIRRIIGYPEAP